jgi:hypothetical protein
MRMGFSQKMPEYMKKLLFAQVLSFSLVLRAAMMQQVTCAASLPCTFPCMDYFCVPKNEPVL